MKHKSARIKRLVADKELAQRNGGTEGQVNSTMAWRCLSRPPTKTKMSSLRGGVPLLPSRNEVVTLERVQNLMDQEGI
jgi:hypothetical protein